MKLMHAGHSRMASIILQSNEKKGARTAIEVDTKGSSDFVRRFLFLFPLVLFFRRMLMGDTDTW